RSRLSSLHSLGASSSLGTTVRSWLHPRRDSRTVGCRTGATLIRDILVSVDTRRGRPWCMQGRLHDLEHRDFILVQHINRQAEVSAGDVCLAIIPDVRAA